MAAPEHAPPLLPPPRSLPPSRLPRLSQPPPSTPPSPPSPPSLSPSPLYLPSSSPQSPSEARSLPQSPLYPPTLPSPLSEAPPRAALESDSRAEDEPAAKADLGGDLEEDLGGNLGGDLGGDLRGDLGGDLGADLGTPPVETSSDTSSESSLSLGGALEAVKAAHLQEELSALLTAEAKLHAEVVVLKACGVLECRASVAAVCRTVGMENLEKEEAGGEIAWRRMKLQEKREVKKEEANP